MTGLFTLLLAGRLAGTGAPGAAPVVVRFQPVFGPADLVLDTVRYPTPHNGAVVVSSLRFYISGLHLRYADGSYYAEPRSYHLVDAANKASYFILLPEAPIRPIKELKFSVGVDSAANTHGAQGGALEPGLGMYWAWHSGYINAKLEGHSAVCPTPGHEFAFHIGGFQAPYNSLRTVTLAVPAPMPLVVRADVGQWLSRLRLAETNSVLLPGAPAMAVADAYAGMFSLAWPHEP